MNEDHAIELGRQLVADGLMAGVVKRRYRRPRIASSVSLVAVEELTSIHYKQSAERWQKKVERLLAR